MGTNGSEWPTDGADVPPSIGKNHLGHQCGPMPGMKRALEPVCEGRFDNECHKNRKPAFRFSSVESF
jgi:hypothetical protein